MERMAHGLSPRVRGNLVLIGLFVEEYRSIPACAGEPEAWPETRAIFTVYPRVCGGTWNCENERMGCLGLSPRVRGNRG